MKILHEGTPKSKQLCRERRKETNRVEQPVKPLRGWVTYNPATATYDTPDGTSVAAELVDNVQCLADVLHIARLREKQREVEK